MGILSTIEQINDSTAVQDKSDRTSIVLFVIIGSILIFIVFILIAMFRYFYFAKQQKQMITNIDSNEVEMKMRVQSETQVSSLKITKATSVELIDDDNDESAEELYKEHTNVLTPTNDDDDDNENEESVEDLFKKQENITANTIKIKQNKNYAVDVAEGYPGHAIKMTSEGMTNTKGNDEIFDDVNI